jgi:tetratricopeptide (TPR) repeat protein
MPELQTATIRRLKLDVCVARSPELDAHAVLLAIRQLDAGDRDGATRVYRDLQVAKFLHPDSWSNLAALAIALDDVEGACRHAQRAVGLARGHVDAWVNLGVACWHAGQRREAAQATARALSLAPALEAAALNYSLMLQAVGEMERAHAVIAGAARREPGSLRMQEAAAATARLLGEEASVREHVLAALRAWRRTAHMEAPVPVNLPLDATPAQHDAMLLAMRETCMRLDAAGIAHVLFGGVVLGIARQGEPFAGDKDIDIALASGEDRAILDGLFADGYHAIRIPEAHMATARSQCMGFVHAATGIGIDLFFLHRHADRLRQGIGWPDHLSYEYPAFASGSLRWRDRDWPVPAPLEDYLASNYGADWRSPWREVGDGRRFDKRWFDTQVSCPGLAADSRARAVNLAMLRLVAALRQGQWPKALALCDQILARESVGEVENARRHLLAAGIR